MTAVDTGPFNFARGDRGVLCVHGFTGTPYEVRPLGEHLASLGFTTVGPVLPGHNGTAEELNRTTWTDWLNAVEGELALLRRRCRRVAVVGLSLGGLLSMALARRNRDLAAACTLSAPLWIGPALAAGARTLIALGVRAIPKAGADIADPEARRTFPSMSQFPLIALGSLLEFMPRVRAELPEIRVPSLILHGDRDHTAPPACATWLMRHIGTIDKRRVRLLRSAHIITVDHDRAEVASEVAAFLQKRMS